MSELRPFVQQVHQVYSAIASKIEELIVSLNEVGEHDDEHIQELCGHINTFLGRLERSVKVEWKSAGRALKDQAKERFLASIQRELKKIKELEAYVALASRKPRPEIIRKIHALYQEVDDEINVQEAIAA